MNRVFKNRGEDREAPGWAEGWDQELIAVEDNTDEEKEEATEEKENRGDEEAEREEDEWADCVEEKEEPTEEKENRGDEEVPKEEDEWADSVEEMEEAKVRLSEDLHPEIKTEVTDAEIVSEENVRVTEAVDAVRWERADHWEETTHIPDIKSTSTVKLSEPLSWYSPLTVAQLFVAGWRCLFLVLKTLETALAVSPTSSPYSLDLLCSLRHLSVPGSRQEFQQRFMDNYVTFSGDYYKLLRSLVCCCVCRFASPWRVGLSAALFAVYGFLPLVDRRVGPYLMPRDFQMVFLCFVALCVSGVVDIGVWCLLLACPFVAVHLLLHDPSTSPHRPIFSSLAWG